MKQFLLFLILLCFSPAGVSFASVMEGGVSKTGAGAQNRIIDNQTSMPVPNARVSLPKQNYSTKTDANGVFDLNADINGQTILSVEKEGYRPFSLTIDDKVASIPMVVAIEKSNVQDMVLAAEMFHLGDDNYSNASANSGEFRGRAVGPFYSKTFKMTAAALSKTNYLVIGSIIGIDTLMAKKLGQNKVVNSYASPPEVYFNGSKIAEIQLNGDGQRIKLPTNLIRPDRDNEITIKTGKNLMQTAYVDYDDIELMNISIQSE
ncbi:MAG: carboxypeptidase-like regulatory domain-containing protein [Candidatus Gastranaerophilaceae bacterium]